MADVLAELVLGRGAGRLGLGGTGGGGRQEPERPELPSAGGTLTRHDHDVSTVPRRPEPDILKLWLTVRQKVWRTNRSTLNLWLGHKVAQKPRAGNPFRARWIGVSSEYVMRGRYSGLFRETEKFT